MKDFIAKDDVQSLTSCIFEQKLASSEPNSKGFTMPLCAEDELAVVEKFLAAPSVWGAFLERYIDHYPLFNESTHLLIKHLEMPDVLPLVQKIFSTYGYTPADVHVLSQKSYSPQIEDAVLQMLCAYVRMFNKDVFAFLEKYDIGSKAENRSNYTEQYCKNAENAQLQRKK